MEDPGWTFDTVKGAPAGFSASSSHDGASSSNGKDRVLKSVILPALNKIIKSKKESEEGANTSSIEELKKAFELAEVSKAGICESLVQEICTTMLSL